MGEGRCTCHATGTEACAPHCGSRDDQLRVKTIQLEQYEAKFKILNDQLKKYHDYHFMVVNAHQKLLRSLFQMTQSDDDPEMNQSLVDAALKKFFDDVEYPDIPSMISAVKTYY